MREIFAPPVQQRPGKRHAWLLYSLTGLLLPLLFAITALLALLLSTHAFSAEPAPPRQDELRELLEQDCGSCHGLRLTGGLGPALTVDALQGKSAEFIALSIRDGRPGTPMPPWRGLLSDADIAWLAVYLKNGDGR